MKKSDLPNIGQPLNGGFFAGLLSTAAGMIAIIVSPKAEGTANDKPWGKYGEKIIGADSFNDGKNNTVNMAVAGSETALWAQSLNINGFDDWYIPSRDELETIYRNLKPTTNDNYVYRHGENPSAIELSDRFPYTENLPAQTSVEIFQKDGSESLDPVWHWSSTQYSARYAWYQDFEGGYQDIHFKNDELAVRAVRRELVIQ
jgi:hypothetical protein